MVIKAVVKHISVDEKEQIDRQVKTELIDHLYQGCLPGTITGFVISPALFVDYYGHTPTHILVTWIVLFNLMMASLTALFFVYLKYKEKVSTTTWGKVYSLVMSGCALAWVPGIYLLPEDKPRQYLALLAIFMATTGYATGSIGQFSLCVTTLNIILLPLVAWCLLKGGTFYNIVALFSFTYMFFMMGINHRSTRWFIDSIKLKLENTLVSYQANHDLLTNLPNRRLLPQFIQTAIDHVNGTDKNFVLVCFSLNRMEMINDSLGYQAGNTIMQTIAERLNQLNTQINPNDETKYIITISRQDTFNILIVPLRADEIERRVKLLFSVLDEPFYLKEQGVKLTASLGVSVYPKDGKDDHALSINADAAMLQAKHFGGNQIEYYRSEINAQIPKMLELESDLHDAIKNNQLQVYYQPLVDLKSGKIIGSEALLRWPHPVRGFISPVNFIPLAEETGLIVPIGAWVLQEACRQTRVWQQMGFSALKIAVNVSEKQLRQDGLVETVKYVLKETDFEARYLELEITETAMLDEKVTAIMKEFSKLGISLAVDDFGTGYSGLSYLKRFSINKLKIDQSFIRDIPASSDSITIVSAILAMAKELKVISLAEGVETEEQLLFLRSKGCDVIQGYYFSKPLDSANFTKLLMAHRNLAIYPPSTEMAEA